MIILTSSYSRRYENVLRSFSAAGILNVGILYANQTDCVFVSHNPFLHGDSAITYTRNPKNWMDAFPNKLKNLHGHKMILLSIEKPPGVIFKGQSVFGIETCVAEMVMRKWKATFQFKEINTGDKGLNRSVMNNLYINLFPYYMSIRTLDFVPASYQDQIRVLVKYKDPQYTFGFIAKNLVNEFEIGLICTFISYIILYYILFYRKSPVVFKTGWRVLPIMFRQPVSMTFEVCRERIYVAAGIWLAFFTLAAYECQFTSSMVAYYPERKIKSLSELTERNIKVFSDHFVLSLLQQGQYNLSSNFLNQIQVVDEKPWNRMYHGSEYAYVISMMYNDFFLKSAANSDQFGYDRFYLLDHIIATVPLVHSFLSHSPFIEEYRITQNRILEAGLPQYCKVKTFQKDVWNLWTNFHAIEEHPLRKYTQQNQINIATCILIGGWAMSFMCLCIEISIKKYQELEGKPIRDRMKSMYRKVKERIERKSNNLKLRRGIRKA